MEQVYPTVPDSASEEHHYFTNESIALDQGGGVAGAPEAGGFTPTPDVLLDQFLPDLSGSEFKIIMYVARRTYGFLKQSDEISVSQMERGITKRDGTVLDRGTGLTRKTIIASVGSLLDKGLLMKVRNYDPRRGDTANTYRMTLPKPCEADESTTPHPEGKNYTPRVQDLHPQERVEQETEIPSGGSTPAKGSSAATPKAAEENPAENNVIRLQEKRPPKSSGEIAVSRLVRGVEDAGGRITSSSKGKYGGQFRRLVDEDGVTDDELERVVDRIVTRWPEIELPADRALSDVLNGRDASEKAGRSSSKGSARCATPEPALTALREHEKFGKFSAAAERHDFTSRQEPEWRIWKDCGVGEQECRENARLMGNVARNAMKRAEEAGESKPSNKGSFKEGYEWFFGE